MSHDVIDGRMPLPADVDRLLLILFLQRGAGQGLSFRDFVSLAVSFGDCRFTLDLTPEGRPADWDEQLRYP